MARLISPKLQQLESLIQKIFGEFFLPHTGPSDQVVEPTSTSTPDDEVTDDIVGDSTVLPTNNTSCVLLFFLFLFLFLNDSSFS